MSSLSRELVFLILQFLDEEKFKDTVHRLEKESGFFFNMRYFEDSVTAGEWDDVEKYLSGFTKVDDNRYSMKIFFEIRKQKYLEALDKKDHAKAVDILVKELKVFSTFNEELFKEITMLLTLTNFRENEQLSKYGDTKSARGIMLGELKKLIEANPLFRDKLQFPSLKNSRLRTLINQSLNWQHQLCKNPRPNPDIKTLFVDHTCGHPNGAHTPSPTTNHLMGSVPKVGGFPPLGAHGPFQPTPAPLTTSLAGWMPNPSVQHPTVSAGPIGLGAPNSAVSMLKRERPRSPPTNSLSMDYQTADSESVLKRPRPFGISDGVNNLPVNVLPVTYPGQSHAHATYSTDDLPKNVSRILSQGSAIKSMDFHPVQQTMLLVGTNLGDIAIWEVGSREKLVSRSFKVWDLATCTVNLQASLASEYTAAVNRVVWSPDGGLLGVAYSKHIVHIYSYHGGEDLRNHLEIDAHAGNVNDLAFSQPNQQLCVVTCGEDKTIKVWDAVTGNKLHTFEGHEAPVYSVCPHQKENIQFIFSTAVDGKIKAWLYDNMGSRVDYDAPGRSCTSMAYCADGTRLFSCGTSKEGESFIVEWNESEGAVKRTYLGLGKRSVGVVQFDTMKNKFLVAGDEFQVKFWDMDSVDLLSSTAAEGGLPSSPCLRINKEGTLLAVSTTDNGIKILANAEGSRILHSMANRGLDSSRAPPGSVAKGPIVGTFGTPNSSTGMSLSMGERSGPVASVTGLNGDNRSLPDVKPRIADDAEKSKTWKLTEISERSQLRTLRLPDTLLPWIKGDSCLLTASGDQTIKVWDVEENKCTGVLIGHTGTVKSMCSHPTNSDLLVSGSRDGCFALWDLRCKSSSHKEEFCINSTGMVKGAHLSPLSKRIRRRKAASSSITSVLYVKDEITIATAGAPDSALKFWDIRKLKAPFAQASPQSDPTNTKEKRSHGIVSLSQDSSGTYLTASCKDNRIYLYNTLRLDKGPVQSFSGCRIDSFFVRTMISPDGEYVLSGSSDGNAYIWQVNKPQVDPIILKGHDFEVTAVDWSPSEIGKVATASDDFTVRLWNIENNICTNANATASVSRVKRRVTALSNTEAKERLEMNRETESPQKHSSLSSDDDYNNDQSMPIIRTPESQKKKTSSSSSLSSLSSEEDIICERTPETTFNSPSSVLNPPSSVKRRTIRDYFLVTP